MPRPLQSLVLGRSILQIWPHGATTILPDGRELPAAPNDTPEYRATAARLGYPQDDAGCLQMCRDHEATHSAIAALLGLPASPALWNAALGRGPSALTGADEDAAMALQRLARMLDIDLIARIAATLAAR